MRIFEEKKSPKMLNFRGISSTSTAVAIYVSRQGGALADPAKTPSRLLLCCFNTLPCTCTQRVPIVETRLCEGGAPSKVGIQRSVIENNRAELKQAIKENQSNVSFWDRPAGERLGSELRVAGPSVPAAVSCRFGPRGLAQGQLL